jgi:ATP-dependent DNA helicase RecG
MQSDISKADIEIAENGEIQPKPKDAARKTLNSTHKTLNSTHKRGNSTHKKADSTHKAAKTGDFLDDLEIIAKSVSTMKRAHPSHVKQAIIHLCRDRFLKTTEIARLLKRSSANMQGRYIRPMLADGLLRMKYPDEPNRPDQAYTTNDRIREIK